MQDLTALEGKTILELREIAKVLGITPSNMKKGELLEKIIAAATGSNSDAEQASHEEKSEGAEDRQPRRGRRPRMSSIKVEGGIPQSSETKDSGTTEVAATTENSVVESPATEVEAEAAPEPTEERAPKRRGRKPRMSK
ncbi:MAG: Rho termination factor N-terminal domain-containing protein, partial [Alistipes sp.]|nr:Rho termination factor N-terminal domain-containing protein [Alistipes sp.]